MIPVPIQDYLREHHIWFEPRPHRRAVAAQRLAAAEHVSGNQVAKVVVVRADGDLVMAVISASQHLNAERLRQVLGARQLMLAAEDAYSTHFQPCETGAEPPLALYGMPIFVDGTLALQPRLLMRAGTHEDAVEIYTDDWLLSERVRIVDGLGVARS
jgi:Ala-tRNA(Pro) deacylase